jgi:hypothetical protein
LELEHGAKGVGGVCAQQKSWKRVLKFFVVLFTGNGRAKLAGGHRPKIAQRTCEKKKKKQQEG